MNKYSVGDIVIIKPWENAFDNTFFLWKPEWWDRKVGIPMKITCYDHHDSTYCLNHLLWVQEAHITAVDSITLAQYDTDEIAI